jgi:formylmethanofuran dehydrogenase subunit A
MSLLLKNGFVVDPASGLKEKADVFIKDGRFVGGIKSPKETIDLEGRVVMPGGVDIHSHIAGSKVNMGRMMRPENKVNVPDTYTTGLLYMKMGYTFVVDPAMPPLKSLHTHHEFHDIPFIDKAALLLLGNNHIIAENIISKDKKLNNDWVAWYLTATKAYGIKAVNPAGGISWEWAKELKSLDEKAERLNISAREIIAELVRVNEELKMPSSFHVHLNNLGIYGNSDLTLETFDICKGGRTNIAHLQLSCYSGDSWATMASDSDRICKRVARQDGLTCDIGQVVFGDCTTMTADGRLEYHLQKLTHNKWVNFDVENETGTGVTPYTYSKKSAVNAIQWAIGLEIALLLKPEKVVLSTDHPNCGPFFAYPKIISWLMSKDARNKEFGECNQDARRRCILPDLDREYDLYEIAQITRSTPASILGVKCGIKEGNPANLAVYDLHYEEKDPGKIEKAFSDAWMVVKDGEAVYKNKELREKQGETLNVSPKSGLKENDVKEKFYEKYSILAEHFKIG